MEVTTLTNRRYRIGALVISLALFFAATPAAADTISDKKAQAASVGAQISALNTKAEIAAENYNRAAFRYSKLTSEVHTTQSKLSQIHTRMGKLQTRLDTRADHMYRTGPLGFLEVLLNAKTFDDFNTSWDLLTNMSNRDAATVSDLRQTKRESEVAYMTLRRSQTAAAQQKAQMASNKSAVEDKLSQRRTLLNGINAQIRSLIAAQQAAEAAAARARYASSGGGSSWVDPGGSPPSQLARGAKVVWWAKSRLGCDYVWAASGPSTFDCSGLAMWCYDKVGVSLPHSSAEQINNGSRVSRSSLEPGDLVFFGSPIHHVGIYVGGGQMIEAPYTGAQVRYANAFRDDYAGACRP
jgi:peptidoglycan DL-endopeptidase CwlO